MPGFVEGVYRSYKTADFFKYSWINLILNTVARLKFTFVQCMFGSFPLHLSLPHCSCYTFRSDPFRCTSYLIRFIHSSWHHQLQRWDVLSSQVKMHDTTVLWFGRLVQKCNKVFYPLWDKQSLFCRIYFPVQLHILPFTLKIRTCNNRS